MEFEKCTIMSGFRRSSHIWSKNQSRYLSDSSTDNYVYIKPGIGLLVSHHHLHALIRINFYWVSDVTRSFLRHSFILKVVVTFGVL